MQVNEVDLVLYSFRENMPSHFKFKEYCPMVFRNLRERFGIDDQDFQVSSLSNIQTGIYAGFKGWEHCSCEQANLLKQYFFIWLLVGKKLRGKSGHSPCSFPHLSQQIFGLPVLPVLWWPALIFSPPCFPPQYLPVIS